MSTNKISITKKPLDSSNDSSSKENKYNGKGSSKKKHGMKDSKKKKKNSANGSDGNQDDSDFANDNGESDASRESDEEGFNFNEKTKTLLVTYFNTAKLEELQALIQSKKLETVIALRPFRSFGELVGILSKNIQIAISNYFSNNNIKYLTKREINSSLSR